MAAARQFVWQHPEWWALTISLAAWAVLFARDPDALPMVSATGAVHVHATGADALARGALDLPAAFLASVVMTAAMMLPLAVVPVRLAAFRSLWRRRHVAIAGFLVGYVAMWSASFTAVIVLFHMVLGQPPGSMLPTWHAAAVGLTIAAIWQALPTKRAASRACHAGVPLAPAGCRANVDCLRFGVRNATTCITSCWALMLVPLLASHSPVVMAGVTLLCAADRYERVPRRDPRRMPSILAGLALGCATIAVFVTQTG